MRRPVDQWFSEKWRINRARGVILNYLVRGGSLKWVMGVLKGEFGVTKEEALRIVHELETNPSFSWIPNSIERLKELKKTIEESTWR